ncbi:arginine--tRNA ligase [Rickettsia rickettsii]|uniref:Arginine--tRNA ligase n=2 Tax=Rickettsia rickettsii TaxID=783 RepID=SYR_RICRO|nr:arginine--tRNA ligase [Rickettsia rickettsii]A8GQM8.1 RecName: Full=Arginine--tRNA ligase; AltName: Full=Arginyl-tRNA synthetase; Short=ArgRS [Rickettsia rickettsii str. 'Sheila Smith']B0BW17.1 RecName: Full=Arginine--tRNA ligase; AltName: Full=Arginyl-tRNA synthetase; Short=ArgRS [Rickettsia rickettsii str. Iowa]ABV75703.1 arginyl-tRNA synthetase [Rickettsia rickettsii str. 'Sheila Smith']ABY72043.1 arginyl-tRNA synthetase [Rickettsia rickettsii str. Iowa]AFB22734.1 arginyl-tRNA synthetase
MNIFNQLKQDIIVASKQLYNNQAIANTATIDIPKDSFNGDLSSNVAMIIAAKESIAPREVALKFKEVLITLPYIASIEIAGPGFINFTIKADSWQASIKDILQHEEKFFEIDIDKSRNINIEYVSANPTGPMHIGHARGAVYGDVLARILQKVSYSVTKEYYVNDAGSQINDLVSTVLLRYKEALGEQITIPAGLYPGEYLIPLGQILAKEYGNKLLTMNYDERFKIIKSFAVEKMLDLNRKDLADLGIKHDIFFSEQSLHDKGEIEETVKLLESMGLIYEGTLPAPKGKIHEEWDNRVQKLFKSTKYGDSQDRPIEKADGSWSYFASDLAYAKDKIERGANHLIYVLGADHSGYVKRIEAIVKALGKEQVKVDVKICQLVNFVENGVPVKMSKRLGSFASVQDVNNEVGKDIIRFMMLTRQNDKPLDFDLVKVKEQSRENPIFYVQYAHVRTISILSKARELMPESYNNFESGKYDLSLLSSEEEIEIIKLLVSWTKTLEASAKYFEPHRIAFYLINLASKFHSMWNFGKENSEYRFVIESNKELTLARLALASAIQKVIASGLEVIGVEPMNKM